ncbi:(deoxy)nucleoside triphosphate pyrophosphohydrolase [Streptomyces sp. NRRL B-24484]|uniref:(deoxy)nucleoside triphosphate pyrophosphohydrolase n=1 Tax=Streptomyces sp. NRRL B-24484 TaxID=1463833 RepID=UPI002D219324|nr:(deoxy)nucleoside triphosphate pyrophosphohydrolase [Streptomyces sp. NRRL B-24484]
MDDHRVMRQDDNGNRFPVATGLGRAEAEALAAEFEARGHKQLYWVEAVAPRTQQDAPQPEVRYVVGGALVHRGRVLAARRSAPPETAGYWEFPGGKAEPGETQEQALERELAEELGVRARALRPLPGSWPVRAGLELRIWAAELLSGEPRPLADHSELRWLGPDELDDVEWLAHDREVLPHVAELLAAG